ncbi:MAG TPA: rRNA maturation RNAse YbeY, partial [Chloroflexia bacterium]|nr:rRNA maturation RNAse YbeY [Chloroflexia bacterium]
MDDGGLVSTTSPDEYWISVQIAPEFEAAMDMEHLHAIAVHTLLAEGHREPLELGITITTDQEIHTLNKQYLDHDYPTDVLSFGSGTALLERNPGGVDTEPDEREPVRADEYVTEGYEGEEPDGANQPERPIRDAESAGPGSETGAVAFVTPPGWPRYLGDVVISYETAAV